MPTTFDGFWLFSQFWKYRPNPTKSNKIQPEWDQTSTAVCQRWDEAAISMQSSMFSRSTLN